MKPRKPQPPFEFSFTLIRRGGADPHCVSLHGEAWDAFGARSEVELLKRRMLKELTDSSEATKNARH